MSGYEILVAESIVLIDGRYCTEVKIYSHDGPAGTYDIEGIYYLSRDSRRLLYRYNAETGIPEPIGD